MTILYIQQPDGGFLAGCTETGRTAFAYPTSVYARQAARNPAKTARVMVKAECKTTIPQTMRLLIERNAAWLDELRKRGTAI